MRALVDTWLYRSGIREDHTAQWFSHDNPEATESRERLAQDSLEMLIQWLKEGGNVGIHGSSSDDYDSLGLIKNLRCYQ